MSAEFVWNEASAEQLHKECGEAMRNQAIEMQGTIEESQGRVEEITQEIEEKTQQAAECEQQAAEQDIIAETAMKTISIGFNEAGYEEFMTVPDIVKRTAARIKAAALRAKAALLRMQIVALQEQIAALKAYITELKAAIEALKTAIAELNRLFQNILEIIRRTDLSYCEKSQLIKGEVLAYIDKMQKLYESFNDTFPLANSPNLSSLQDPSNSAAQGLALGLNAALFGLITACAMSKDPVNLATGNFIYSKEDITIPGRFPLGFKRFYNALGGAEDGILGAGWTHNYNIKLHSEGESAYIAFDDGHVETYQELEDGFYAAPLERNNVLMKTEEGWSLILPAMERYLFDPEGHLLSVTDLNGNRTELAYDDNGLLTQVSNACGSLHFAYNGKKHLTRVSDGAGRHVILAYVNGRLVKVTQPSGAEYQYEYNRQGKLCKLTNPLGTATVRNDFDEQGRTVRQSFADGGVMSYVYNETEKNTVLTQQNGCKLIYKRDDKFRTTGVIYPDGEESKVFDDKDQVVARTNKNGFVSKFEYDDFGHVTKAVDPLGYETLFAYEKNNLAGVTRDNRKLSSFEYDTAGNMLGAADALGRTIQFAYDKKGLPVKMVSPAGAVTGIEYDARGNVTAVTDALGGVTRYEYNALNQVVKTVQPEGNTMRFSYNAAGHIAQVTNAEGNTRSYTYNKSGKVTEVIDWDGGAVRYAYNPMGKLSQVTDPAGGVTKYEYDKMWNIVKVTNANGAEIRYEYDPLERLTGAVDPEGYKTCFAYDPNGNMTRVTEPGGAETAFDYDPLDRRVGVTDANGARTQYVYDAFDNLVKVCDPMGNVYENVYDGANQLIRKAGPLGHQTVFTYNELGLVQSATNAAGASVTYQYNELGKLVQFTGPDGAAERYEYDKNGRVTAFTNALGARVAYQYDSMDRVTAVVNPLGHSKRFTYDAMNRVTGKTDENGHVTRYGYDAAGNLTGVTEADGSHVKYSYDFMRKLTRIEQYALIDEAVAGASRQNDAHTTSYQYDARGLLTRETDALGQTKTYRYDAMGKLIGATEKDQTSSGYAYDPVGMLTKIRYADGREVRLSYNPLRQLVRMQDWLGVTRVEHDPLGRVKNVTDPNGDAVQYEWNALGRREKTVYPDGKEAVYTYTPSGRLSAVDSALGRAEYDYDALGRLSTKRLPNDILSEYTYNPAGLLESLHHRQGAETLDRFEYEYDPVGNMVQILKERRDVPEDSGLFRYGYDALGRLVSAGREQEVTAYSYDGFGNQTSVSRNGMETQRSYNALNQLIRSRDAGGTSEYAYDPRGNLSRVLKDGTVAEEYVFDAANRLVQAAAAGKGVVRYAYNGLNKRVGVVETPEAGAPRDPARFVSDLTRPYNDLLSSDGRQVLWGGGDLLGSVGEDGDSAFYLCDHLGSPIRVVDGAGGHEAMVYDEFGGIVKDGPEWNSFGFTGYQKDGVSELWYAQARYYGPGVGRFVSEDVLKGYAVQPQTQNRYAYCLNNPKMFVDPLGMDDQQAIQNALVIADNEYSQRGIPPIPAEKMRDAMEYAEFYNNDPLAKGGRDEINNTRTQRGADPFESATSSHVDTALQGRTLGPQIVQDRANSFNTSISKDKIYDPYTLGYGGPDNRCAAYGTGILNQLGVSAYAAYTGDAYKALTGGSYDAKDWHSSVIMIVEIGKTDGDPMKVNGVDVVGSGNLSPEEQHYQFLLYRGLSGFAAIFSNDIGHMMFAGEGYSLFGATRDRWFVNLFRLKDADPPFDASGFVYVLLNVDVEGYHDLISCE